MPTPLRILIVEDSENDTLLLARELAKGGYEPTYERVDTLEGMQAALEKQQWDIVLSDYSMPNFRGSDALLLLRERDPDTPFIYVSGTLGEDMAVAAMKAGANDYVMKGNLRRLVPAIRRELQEAETRRERKRLQEERDRLFEETQRNLERIRALHEIDTAISSTLDLRAVLNILLEKIDLFLPIAAATTVRLLNRETREIESLACRGLDEEEWRSQQQTTPGGRATRIVETKAPLALRNILTDSRTYNPEIFRKSGLVSYLGVPLIVKEEVLGVLSLYTNQEHEFSKEEIEFFNTLAGQAAIAIQNSQLFEQTKKQMNDLDRANKVKDEFLSVMSHELRTPLNVVVGYAGMMKDGMLGEVNPKQEEALEKMINRANDQLMIVNNILYATVLETEKINVDIHEFVLGDFLNQLKPSYDLSTRKEPIIRWECAEPLAPIRTDSAKLKLILNNLIDNALKFTKSGEVKISAGISSAPQLPSSPAGGQGGGGARVSYVEFKVGDTGVGIPKEQLPFIFDKFRQADSSETRSFGGVGMGLYIVKQFTALLGATVEVESEVDKGTTFTVTLPCGQ